MIKQDKKLVDLLAPVVAAMGYELLGIDMLKSGHQSTLRIYIDREDGINLADCEQVSHQLTGVLDVHDPISGGYVLEVSSPGINRPLFTLDHFRRFCDHRVKISLNTKLDGRRHYTGTIDAVAEDGILLGDGDEEIEIPVRLIDRAHLIEI